MQETTETENHPEIKPDDPTKASTKSGQSSFARDLVRFVVRLSSPDYKIDETPDPSSPFNSRVMKAVWRFLRQNSSDMEDIFRKNFPDETVKNFHFQMELCRMRTACGHVVRRADDLFRFCVWVAFDASCAYKKGADLAPEMAVEFIEIAMESLGMLIGKYKRRGLWWCDASRSKRFRNK